MVGHRGPRGRSQGAIRWRHAVWKSAPPEPLDPLSRPRRDHRRHGQPHLHRCAPAVPPTSPLPKGGASVPPAAVFARRSRRMAPRRRGDGARRPRSPVIPPPRRNQQHPPPTHTEGDDAPTALPAPRPCAQSAVRSRLRSVDSCGNLLDSGMVAFADVRRVGGVGEGREGWMLGAPTRTLPLSLCSCRPPSPGRRALVRAWGARDEASGGDGSRRGTGPFETGASPLSPRAQARTPLFDTRPNPGGRPLTRHRRRRSATRTLCPAR